MRSVALIPVCLLLAACAAQRPASEIAAEKAQRAAAADAADDAQCRSYNTLPGSDAYAQCRNVLKKGRLDDDETPPPR
jgi:outer membrane biogenesis lipoprotein LolB